MSEARRRALPPSLARSRHLPALVALSLVLALAPVRPGRAAAAPPHVTADAAVLVDGSTGRLLWGSHPHQRRAPASTTKILTGLLALELGHLDDVVTISRNAASTPGSSAYLRAGERYTLADLLHGLLLPSGNDASVAIAEHIAGSVPAFAALMNQRARALGLLDSRFANPSGLTAPRHYSSAYDLAQLARAALAVPSFAAIVRLPHASIGGQETPARSLYSTNRLLLSYGWVDGVKTGTTSAAGSCLVASATRDGHRLIAVVLHSDDRWGDALRLLQYGYNNYSFIDAARAGQLVRSLPVQHGASGYVGLVAARPLSAAVALTELPRVRLETSVAPLAVAPVEQGTVYGSLALLVGDQLVDRVPLVADRFVPAGSWLRRLVGWLERVLGVV